MQTQAVNVNTNTVSNIPSISLTDMSSEPQIPQSPMRERWAVDLPAQRYVVQVLDSATISSIRPPLVDGVQVMAQDLGDDAVILYGSTEDWMDDDDDEEEEDALPQQTRSRRSLQMDYEEQKEDALSQQIKSQKSMLMRHFEEEEEDALPQQTKSRRSLQMDYEEEEELLSQQIKSQKSIQHDKEEEEEVLSQQIKSQKSITLGPKFEFKYFALPENSANPFAKRSQASADLPEPQMIQEKSLKKNKVNRFLPRVICKDPGEDKLDRFIQSCRDTKAIQFQTSVARHLAYHSPRDGLVRAIQVQAAASRFRLFSSSDAEFLSEYHYGEPLIFSDTDQASELTARYVRRNLQPLQVANEQLLLPIELDPQPREFYTHPNLFDLPARVDNYQQIREIEIGGPLYELKLNNAFEQFIYHEQLPVGQFDRLRTPVVGAAPRTRCCSQLSPLGIMVRHFDQQFADWLSTIEPQYVAVLTKPLKQLLILKTARPALEIFNLHYSALLVNALREFYLQSHVAARVYVDRFIEKEAREQAKEKFEGVREDKEQLRARAQMNHEHLPGDALVAFTVNMMPVINLPEYLPEIRLTSKLNWVSDYSTAAPNLRVKPYLQRLRFTGLPCFEICLALLAADFWNEFYLHTSLLDPVEEQELLIHTTWPLVWARHAPRFAPDLRWFEKQQFQVPSTVFECINFRTQQLPISSETRPHTALHRQLRRFMTYNLNNRLAAGVQQLAFDYVVATKSANDLLFVQKQGDQKHLNKVWSHIAEWYTLLPKTVTDQEEEESVVRAYYESPISDRNSAALFPKSQQYCARLNTKFTQLSIIVNGLIAELLISSFKLTTNQLDDFDDWRRQRAFGFLPLVTFVRTPVPPLRRGDNDNPIDTHINRHHVTILGQRIYLLRVVKPFSQLRVTPLVYISSELHQMLAATFAIAPYLTRFSWTELLAEFSDYIASANDSAFTQIDNCFGSRYLNRIFRKLEKNYRQVFVVGQITTALRSQSTTMIHKWISTKILQSFIAYGPTIAANCLITPLMAMTTLTLINTGLYQILRLWAFAVAQQIIIGDDLSQTSKQALAMRKSQLLFAARVLITPVYTQLRRYAFLDTQGVMITDCGEPCVNRLFDEASWTGLWGIVYQPQRDASLAKITCPLQGGSHYQNFDAAAVGLSIDLRVQQPNQLGSVIWLAFRNHQIGQPQIVLQDTPSLWFFDNTLYSDWLWSGERGDRPAYTACSRFEQVRMAGMQIKRVQLTQYAARFGPYSPEFSHNYPHCIRLDEHIAIRTDSPDFALVVEQIFDDADRELLDQENLFGRGGPGHPAYYYDDLRMVHYRHAFTAADDHDPHDAFEQVVSMPLYLYRNQLQAPNRLVRNVGEPEDFLHLGAATDEGESQDD